MAEPRPISRRAGFTLVEMMIALVFTLVLMAGLASVFKASLSTYVTSGEQLSSARRNHASIDMLGDDLQSACMYLTDLTNPPTFGPNDMPPFCVLPNMLFTSLPKSPTSSCDQLLFYMDEALPFEGTLTAANAQESSGTLVNAGQTAGGASTSTIPTGNSTYTIDCINSTYANQVAQGQTFIFKDYWEKQYISAAPTVTGSVVTVTAGGSTLSGVTSSSQAALPTTVSHIPLTKIVFVRPAQMVRYSVQLLKLDPDPGSLDSNLIPCLVRDQAAYNTAGFTPDNPPQPTQVIAENVTGFKVYLSVSPQQIAAGNAAAWAGYDLNTNTYPSGFTSGWTGGLLPELTAQLATTLGTVASSFPALSSANQNWFRSIPTVVRIDITTRTATERAEYAPASTGAPVRAYKSLTQSLVFVPRHSGLPMSP